MFAGFSITNYKSFRNTAEFTMTAEPWIPENLQSNVYTAENGIRLFRTAVITGKNAGGKTSFIESIAYLKEMLRSTGHVKSIHRTCNHHEDNTLQVFEVRAVLNSRLYTYHLEVDDVCTRLEQLTYQYAQSDDAVTVYRAENGEALYGGKTFGLQLPFMAYLHQDASVFFRWLMNNVLVVYTPNCEMQVEQLQYGDESLIMKKDTFLEIFRLADSSITDIRVDEEKPYLDTVIYRMDSKGREYACRIAEDGHGIREHLYWSIYIWKTVYEDKTVFADMFDCVMNPILAEKIITYINNTEHHGQFIFTTHNLLHLNAASFAKGQIWFVDKNEELISDLYSLSSFDDFSYELNGNVYELYLKGILGSCD